MQKLYLNTVDRTWYDADGSQPSDSNPQIPLGNSERISIQCCTETPNAGTPGINPSTDWTKDTQFNLTGVTALLSADNNFTRHLKGQLKTALSAGTVSSAEITIANATVGKIPSTGAVRLFDASGNYEALEYTSRSISGTTVTFTLASGSTLQNSYAVGAVADCPESLYAQASMNASASNPATGLFVFDIVMDSLKLRESSDYADISEIGDVKGLELLIFTVVDDEITIKNAYICDTFRIPVPMAAPDQNPDMPDTYESNVAAITAALLAAGFSLQFSADGTSWHDTQTSSDQYFRFRSASAGGDWSVGIALVPGPQGTTPHIGANGNWYIGDTDTGVAAEVSGSYLTFSSVTSNTVTFAGTETLPVAVLTNAGHLYPVEKGSLAVDTVNNTVTLDVTPYLAYDNAASFSGTWRVYFSAGTSDPGDDISTLTSTAITPKHGAVYVHELAANDSFTISTTGLSATKKFTFDLDLIQPSTAVSFTLPTTGIKWGDGLNFTYSNPVPIMDQANTLYSIRFQWNGRCLLANLAIIEDLGEQS